MVDGKTIVSGSDDYAVRLWNMETGKVLAKWTGHTQPVWSLCWSGDDDRALSGSLDGTARVWDVETGKTILAINTGLDEVYTATFSPDSTLIATGGFRREDKQIKIWDVNTGKLAAILKGHTTSVACLAWTADGRTLISGSYDYTIRTWNTSTWQQLAVLTGHSYPVRGIAISPNGRILASASWDKTAQLWNLENGQPIGPPLQHPERVNCVSFSTDGTLLTTGCWDKNAYTWGISAIIKEAGLNELLFLSLHQLNAPCQDGEKSFLNVRDVFIYPSYSISLYVFQADATPHLVQESENACQLPEGFFAESHSHPNVCDSHYSILFLTFVSPARHHTPHFASYRICT